MTATATDTDSRAFEDLLASMEWSVRLPPVEPVPELLEPEVVQRRWDTMFQEIWNKDERMARVRTQMDEALHKLSARLTVKGSPGGERRHELWALCPFHADHNVGSFSIHRTSGRYFCFVCGAQGGIVSLMDHFNLWGGGARREDVLQYLAEFREVQQIQRYAAEEMPSIPEFVLASMKQNRPLRYLAKGHSRDVLDWLEVGVDLRLQRVAFPVRKASGELVALQTRAESSAGIRWKWYTRELVSLGMDPDWISTWSPPRRTVLWGEDKFFPALVEGRLNRPLVIVEGLGGLMRCVQAGFPAMATFGTQMGPGQLSRLTLALQRAGSRYPVIICPDGDSPGWDAALHHVDMLASVSEVRVAPMPIGTDPEDQSAGQLREALLNAHTVESLLGTRDGKYWIEAFERRLQKLNQRRRRHAEIRFTHPKEGRRVSEWGSDW